MPVEPQSTTFLVPPIITAATALVVFIGSQIMTYVFKRFDKNRELEIIDRYSKRLDLLKKLRDLKPDRVIRKTMEEKIEAEMQKIELFLFPRITDQSWLNYTKLIKMPLWRKWLLLFKPATLYILCWQIIFYMMVVLLAQRVYFMTIRDTNHPFFRYHLHSTLKLTWDFTFSIGFPIFVGLIAYKLQRVSVKRAHKWRYRYSNFPFLRS